MYTLYARGFVLRDKGLGFPFPAQQPVKNHRVALPIPLEKFPELAFTLKAEFAKEGIRTVIVTEHRCLKSVQVQLIKCKAQREPSRFCPVPLPPCCGVAQVEIVGRAVQLHLMMRACPRLFKNVHLFPIHNVPARPNPQIGQG